MFPELVSGDEQGLTLANDADRPLMKLVEVKDSTAESDALRLKAEDREGHARKLTAQSGALTDRVLALETLQKELLAARTGSRSVNSGQAALTIRAVRVLQPGASRPWRPRACHPGPGRPSFDGCPRVSHLG